MKRALLSVGGIVVASVVIEHNNNWTLLLLSLATSAAILAVSRRASWNRALIAVGVGVVGTAVHETSSGRWGRATTVALQLIVAPEKNFANRVSITAGKIVITFCCTLTQLVLRSVWRARGEGTAGRLGHGEEYVFRM